MLIKMKKDKDIILRIKNENGIINFSQLDEKLDKIKNSDFNFGASADNSGSYDTLFSVLKNKILLKFGLHI